MPQTGMPRGAVTVHISGQWQLLVLEWILIMSMAPRPPSLNLPPIFMCIKQKSCDNAANWQNERCSMFMMCCSVFFQQAYICSANGNADINQAKIYLPRDMQFQV